MEGRGSREERGKGPAKLQAGEREGEREPGGEREGPAELQEGERKQGGEREGHLRESCTTKQ